MSTSVVAQEHHKPEHPEVEHPEVVRAMVANVIHHDAGIGCPQDCVHERCLELGYLDSEHRQRPLGLVCLDPEGRQGYGYGNRQGQGQDQERIPMASAVRVLVTPAMRGHIALAMCVCVLMALATSTAAGRGRLEGRPGYQLSNAGGLGFTCFTKQN